MLLDEIGRKVYELLVHFLMEKTHYSNRKIIDLSELLLETFHHALFKWCLHAFKIAHFELFVAI